MPTLDEMLADIAADVEVDANGRLLMPSRIVSLRCTAALFTHHRRRVERREIQAAVKRVVRLAVARRADRDQSERNAQHPAEK